jgi:hypothetical protein
MIHGDADPILSAAPVANRSVATIALSANPGGVDIPICQVNVSRGLLVSDFTR